MPRNIIYEIEDSLKGRWPDGGLRKTPESRDWQEHWATGQGHGSNLPSYLSPGEPRFKKGGVVLRNTGFAHGGPVLPRSNGSQKKRR